MISVKKNLFLPKSLRFKEECIVFDDIWMSFSASHLYYNEILVGSFLFQKKIDFFLCSWHYYPSLKVKCSISLTVIYSGLVGETKDLFPPKIINTTILYWFYKQANSKYKCSSLCSNQIKSSRGKKRNRWFI